LSEVYKKNSIIMIHTIQRIITIGVIIIAASSFLCAQTIDNITVSPNLPTTDDSIFIFVECTFPNMGCQPYTQDVSQDSSNIYASALHCVGSLTAICTYTDTFKVSSLSAGDYTFFFTLNAGQAPEPCTPGILPYDNDSVEFTVTTATTISDISHDPLSFSIHGNLTDRHFNVYLGSAINVAESYQLHVVSNLGREVRVAPLYEMSNDINLALQPGLYFCYIETGGYRSGTQKILITAGN
jgi:hypothetical protein